MKTRVAWILVGAIASALVVWFAWLVVKNSPAYALLVRLYMDQGFLKQTLQEWGVLAPVLFISLQIVQVVVSPIPGEPVGILGGYLFGPWVGLVYNMIGLTLGSLVCFAIGRWLGAHYVRRLVSARTWQRIGFIVEAEGGLICAVIFVIPGLPKDLTCYLFGVSPIRFWVFAVVSTVARIPHTWVLSMQGAQTASGDYLELALLTAIFLLVVLPVYYYRTRLMEWLRGKGARDPGGRVESGNDRRRPP